MTISKGDALQSLKPGAEWAWTGSDYSGLVWKDSKQTQPTESEINAELTRLQTEYDNKQYQRNRAKSYPSVRDQLDMQYWDKKNGTTTWVDAVAKVKSDNPKP
tara:strand:- start:771 stop:1079 length:309 start_codon:yes stop_codon:yes gene_type:complete